MGTRPSGKVVASYCFPPYNDTSGIVAAKRVLSANERVDVISNRMDGVRKLDTSLVQIVGGLIDRHAALNTPTGFASWRSVSTYASTGSELFQRWEHDRGPYAEVYSRAQFAASHVLGAKIKTLRPDIVWTAEFSDPLSHGATGDVRYASVTDRAVLSEWGQQLADLGYASPLSDNLHEWVETRSYALADSIVFTNQAQQKFMLSHCGDRRLAERVAERSIISPHPTLPRKFYSMVPSSYPLPTDKVNIGYFGKFYPNRGPGLILDALAGLPPHVRKHLLIHAFTSTPEELKELTAAKKVSGVVRVNPYRDYLEFLNLADRMDVLLLNDAVTPPGGTNPFLPSKWSDYKGADTPVWGIIEEGSPLDAVSGIAYRTPVEHVSAIQLTLAQIAADLSSPNRAGALAFPSGSSPFADLT